MFINLFKTPLHHPSYNPGQKYMVHLENLLCFHYCPLFDDKSGSFSQTWPSPLPPIQCCFKGDTLSALTQHCTGGGGKERWNCQKRPSVPLLLTRIVVPTISYLYNHSATVTLGPLFASDMSTEQHNNRGKTLCWLLIILKPKTGVVTRYLFLQQFGRFIQGILITTTTMGWVVRKSLLLADTEVDVLLDNGLVHEQPISIEKYHWFNSEQLPPWQPASWSCCCHT